MKVIHDGDAGEEGDVVGRKPGNQAADQVLALIGRAGRHGIDDAARIGAALHGSQHELQAERPSIGHLVQPCATVRIHPAAKRPRTRAMVSSKRKRSASGPMQAH